MSRFCKFGKLHVTKGNVDKLLGILLTASKELKRSLAPTGNLYRSLIRTYCYPIIDWRGQYIYIRVPPVNQNILLDFFCNHGAVRNMLS